MLHEQPHAPLTVLEVCEHGARKELLPQCLPEPLDLPARLRMMRPALHVHDPVATQLRFELRRAAPSSVLPTLIGQNLARRPVVGNPPSECLKYQGAALMMSQSETDKVTGVIV
jgi:hypothetical protein